LDLFAALNYAGPENRSSVMLIAVLHHLSDGARAALLRGVLGQDLGPATEIRAQHAIGVGVLDGWLRWSGRCVVALEAKVDSALGTEQPERYCRWLASQDEPDRVLWLLGRDRSEIEAVVSASVVPDGVRVAPTTWTELANRALEIASSASEVDKLLLGALGRRLRATGVASSPTLPMDPTLLGLALGTLPQIRLLREHLVAWFRSFSWLPGEWTREARHGSWVDLSVYAQRPFRLAKRRADGRDSWIVWWVEVFAPSSKYGRWPAEQGVGASLRVGFLFKGVATAEIALEPLRAALGLPAAERRSDFQPSPEEVEPVSGAYGLVHEVWWLLQFDPTDLAGSEGRLRAAMADQARRVAPLVEGGLGAVWVGIGHPVTRKRGTSP
jgi:hypothetical protein